MLLYTLLLIFRSFQFLFFIIKLNKINIKLNIKFIIWLKILLHSPFHNDKQSKN